MLRRFVPAPVKQLVRAYRASRFKWRYVDNLRPLLHYQLGRHTIEGEVPRVLHDLNRDGIAITSVEDLLGPVSLFGALRDAVDRLEREQADAIEQAREQVGQRTKHKSFIYPLLGERPVLDPNDVFVRFALQEPLLQIANAYFGMYTHLRFYNVWHTLATEAPPQRSQLWHQDPEDHFIVKVFVYLSDVDEQAGPFTYAPGTHPKGNVEQRPEWFKEKGHGARRSTDEQMAAMVPPDRWIVGTGATGTIIFADTRGYHKGGLAQSKDRIMYNCMFTSPAGTCEDLFERPDALGDTLNREQAIALNAA